MDNCTHQQHMNVKQVLLHPVQMFCLNSCARLQSTWRRKWGTAHVNCMEQNPCKDLASYIYIYIFVSLHQYDASDFMLSLHLPSIHYYSRDFFLSHASDTVQQMIIFLKRLFSSIPTNLSHTSVKLSLMKIPARVCLFVAPQAVPTDAKIAWVIRLYGISAVAMKQWLMLTAMHVGCWSVTGRIHSNKIMSINSVLDRNKALWSGYVYLPVRLRTVLCISALCSTFDGLVPWMCSSVSMHILRRQTVENHILCHMRTACQDLNGLSYMTGHFR